MTKLCCLPVEATNYMVEMGGKQSLRPALTYAAMLAAAPPPPADIAEALRSAKNHLVHIHHTPLADCLECALARALLKSWGRE